MKVIVIAAGESKRLGEHTKNIPKAMLKVGNKKILDFQLEFFKKEKIKDIIIVTGKHHEIFDFKDVVYTQDENSEKHDVLGSLMCARKYMDNEVITTYSDIILDETILKSMINSEHDISIGVDLNWRKKYEGRTEHPKEQADNVLLENGKILKIRKNIIDSHKDQIIGEFIGIMKLSKNGCEKFIEIYEELENKHLGSFHDANQFEKAYLTDMLQELIVRGINVKPVFIHGEWLEIDTPQDLNKAKDYFG